MKVYSKLLVTAFVESILVFSVKTIVLENFINFKPLSLCFNRISIGNEHSLIM